MVRAKIWQHMVVLVTVADVEKHGSYGSAAHGIKVENEEVCSESILFD